MNSPISCDICGSPVPIGPNVRGQLPKRCSDECRKEHARRRRRAGRAEGRHADTYEKRGPWRGVRVCRFCGEDFDAKSPKATVCYERTCQRAKHAERARAFQRRYRAENGVSYGWDRYRAQRIAYAVARRELLEGAAIEVFDPVEVFERDGWVCGLCGDPIDPALSWPDPRSVSLDHVEPLALGGDHSRANTQAAHLTCNAGDGSLIRELARLV